MNWNSTEGRVTCRLMHSASNATVADQFFNIGARKRVLKILNFKLISVSLSQAGEMSLEESKRAIQKVLVITESMLRCLGAIVIGSDS